MLVLFYSFFFPKVPKTNGTPITSYLLQYARDANGPFEKVLWFMALQGTAQSNTS